MPKLNVYAVVEEIAEKCNPEKATFDQLAEEVMELHLAMRGKHDDPIALEWLAIASIAINALKLRPVEEVLNSRKIWMKRHA